MSVVETYEDSATQSIYEKDREIYGTFRDFGRKQVKHYDRIALFYKELHEKQTVEYVLKKRAEYAPLNKRVMTIWEAMDMLEHGTPVDESDPDTESTQDVHAYQTGEACRRLYPDERYDWFHLAGFLHDITKILAHPVFGEPQWAVVGDKNPVGCAFSDYIVYPEFFKGNPDYHNPKYNTKFGIYEPHCGFDNVLMNWGHDEYFYMVMKQSKLPEEALYLIRYHSFYAWHQHGAYEHLASEYDKKMLFWQKEFQKCDLYSKSDLPQDKPDVAKLRPYYEKLVEKYFPNPYLRW